MSWLANWVGAGMLAVPVILLFGAIVIDEHRRGEHLVLGVLGFAFWVGLAFWLLTIRGS